MYAHLNTSEMLTVEPSDKKGFRFLYKIVNKEYGGILHSRYSNRKFIAATIAGTYFGSIERVKDHQHAMMASGAGEYISQGYYCYLEDADAFQPDSLESGPKLAYSLINTKMEGVTNG